MFGTIVLTVCLEWKLRWHPRGGGKSRDREIENFPVKLYDTLTHAPIMKFG